MILFWQRQYTDPFSGIIRLILGCRHLTWRVADGLVPISGLLTSATRTVAQEGRLDARSLGQLLVSLLRSYE